MFHRPSRSTQITAHHGPSVPPTFTVNTNHCTSRSYSEQSGHGTNPAYMSGHSDTGSDESCQDTDTGSDESCQDTDIGFDESCQDTLTLGLINHVRTL